MWAKYIEYLKVWAESHKGSEYEGMSPACYAEWCDNEATVEDDYCADYYDGDDYSESL